jgi:dihydrofolate synthase / folylpolyglutamate synthase
MQIEKSAAGILLIDAAHNVSSAEQLRRAVERQFPKTPPALVLGILRDKDWPEMCRILAPCASRILAVPVQSERAATAAEICSACSAANPGVSAEAFSSLAGALEAAAGEPFVLITGSVYLAGEAMERLGISPATPQNERALNEWSQTP